MSSNRPKFDDHAFDFEALVSDPAAKNDAALSTWAMGSATSQRQQHTAPQPVPVSPAARTAVVSRPSSRGQLLSWTALLLAVGLSAVAGYGVYAALNAIDVTSADSVATASHWTTLPVFGLVGLVATLVLAIVALFRARPRLVATVALVLTLLLPVVALLVGAKYGGDALVRHVHDSAGLVGSRAADHVISLLSQQGVDVGPLTKLIEGVFG